MTDGAISLCRVGLLSGCSRPSMAGVVETTWKCPGLDHSPGWACWRETYTRECKDGSGKQAFDPLPRGARDCGHVQAVP